MAEAMERLNRSLDDDFRLWPYDTRASQAWARALGRAGVLEASQVEQLERGLTRVAERLAEAPGPGGFADEDIHTLVERLLTEDQGSVGGRLHTGRSRNDQVATDMRLWGKDAAARLEGQIVALVRALAALAHRAGDRIMPGYTHLQRAQPIRVAHWALSHAWPFVRDAQRVRNAARSADSLPLGSGALAGCPFPVDRRALAEDLGFAEITPNSLDATSDRDWMLDLSFACATTGTHISRLGEDLVLFSSREFGFVRLGDAYTTGSSLMPQKRNPDVAELARGSSAVLIGDLTALLALVKGGPTGYNRDLQHDKAVVFRQTDLLETVLPALTGAVESCTFDDAALERATTAELLATDAADHLVDAGLPFRESHELVGALVRAAEDAGVDLDGLSSAQREAVHPALGSWTVDAASFRRSADARSVEGGTAGPAVERQMKRLERTLDGLRQGLD